jgi:hypothetical protein
VIIVRIDAPLAFQRNVAVARSSSSAAAEVRRQGV